MTRKVLHLLRLQDPQPARFTILLEEMRLDGPCSEEALRAALGELKRKGYAVDRLDDFDVERWELTAKGRARG
ncbi:MAG TPA: hypothetical protein PLU30_23555 [Verrucomicrobiae bacterium]|jgi:hypothetical protein|nr:hypothetical protein [Verrucomicrobiae bacterium]